MGMRGLDRRGEGVLKGRGLGLLLFCCLESEVTRTRVAIVVELLLDVDHVATGVFQLSELGPATEISKITELGQPRPRWGIWRNMKRGNRMSRGCCDLTRILCCMVSGLQQVKNYYIYFFLHLTRTDKINI